MRERYVSPEVEIIVFEKRDVITSSCGEAYELCGGSYTPCHHEGTGICNPYDAPKTVTKHGTSQANDIQHPVDFTNRFF